jgi:hypothetical protein
MCNLWSLVTFEFCAATLLGLVVVPARAGECDGALRDGIKQSGTALIFHSRALDIDADGAPNAYRPDGKGLSYTCDGMVAVENGKRVTPDSDPEHWESKCLAAWQKARISGDYSGLAIFALELDDHGRPLVQAEGDPMHGQAFIARTSYAIPGMPAGTQRSYVDATQIPYVVLPANVIRRYALVPGSIAMVYRPSTGRFAFGVYGDEGGLGEASVKLHQDLGNNPFLLNREVKRAKNRIEDPVVTFVFPAATSPPVADAAAWNADIQQRGQAALDEFGGIQRVMDCAKPFDD